TKKEDYRLEARALYAALQPLKRTDVPARYASPYAKPIVAGDDVSTLAGEATMTLALLLLFEITGDQRFVDEADRLFDGIAAMRGRWCAPSRCATGLVYDVADGKLGTTFCSGCNFEVLYALEYRRSLAQ